MLRIEIAEEFWDSVKEEFVASPKTHVLQLEHSLVSISKWEAKYHRAFCSKRDKSAEELLEYIKCMTITQNVNPDVYNHLSNKNFIEINSYIQDPMTATWFPEEKSNNVGMKDVVTSELIYYWMIRYNIPFECQKWHLNRLLALIKVCQLKCEDTGKMNKRDIFKRNNELNNARRAALRSKG